jgi:WD40 repeat protein
MVHEDNPPVTSVCFAPNGRYILTFSMDSCLRLWDYVSGSVKKTYQGHANSAFSVGGCFGVVDGEPFVAAASEDGDVVLWDVNTREIVQRIGSAHQGVCFWVDIVGDTLVSCGQDGKIKVFRHRGPGAESRHLRNGIKGGGGKALEDQTASRDDGARNRSRSRSRSRSQSPSRNRSRSRTRSRSRSAALVREDVDIKKEE